MKYVLDENLQMNDEDLPDSVINASDLYFRNGLREHGVDDQKLLSLATENGYTIVTQDQKLIVVANKKNIDIIYAFGRAGKQWHYISRELDLFDRGRLRRFVQFDFHHNKNENVVVKLYPPYYLKGYIKPKKIKENKETMKTLTKLLGGDESAIVPFFMMGNSNKLDLREPKFYDGMRGIKKTK